MQQWYKICNSGAEEALYDIQSMRAFCNLELGRDPIPDKTTILNFRHLLEAHGLTKTVFEAVAEYLEARALLRGGTIVDATLIAASPSTKNEAGKRDPQMHSSKKGNQWYFGMKAHVGVDAISGLVHTGTLLCSCSNVTGAWLGTTHPNGWAERRRACHQARHTGIRRLRAQQAEADRDKSKDPAKPKAELPKLPQ